MAINQKAVKVINKILDAGFTDEKAISAMTMDDILSIQGVTVADIALINELQKAVPSQAARIGFPSAISEQDGCRNNLRVCLTHQSNISGYSCGLWGQISQSLCCLYLPSAGTVCSRFQAVPRQPHPGAGQRLRAVRQSGICNSGRQRQESSAMSAGS